MLQIHPLIFGSTDDVLNIYCYNSDRDDCYCPNLPTWPCRWSIPLVGLTLIQIPRYLL